MEMCHVSRLKRQDQQTLTLTHKEGITPEEKFFDEPFRGIFSLQGACYLVVQRADTVSATPERCTWRQSVTTEAMYVKRNIQARSCNHCCNGKAISTVFFCARACVCVTLVIQHANRMRRIV
jgi:hypothetical protein